MTNNPLQPLATRLLELESDRDAATERGRELAEEVANLLARKERLEEEIGRLKEAMTSQAGQTPRGSAAVGDEGLEPPTPSV